MNIVQIAAIADPEGIDVPIQDMQIYLAANLSNLNIKYVFGRAYKIDEKPYVFQNKGSEYLDVFADNSLSMLFFDVESENQEMLHGHIAKVPVNIIVSVRLTDWYNVAHRATEEVTRDFYDILQLYNESHKWGLHDEYNIVTGIENVYANYDTSSLHEAVDQQPSFVFSIKTNLVYYYTKESCEFTNY
jgi:hypothetical protein